MRELLCSIAGFRVRIICRYDYLPDYCRDYLITDDHSEDITISVDDCDIERERGAFPVIQKTGYLESVAVYRKLCSVIPMRGAFLLHSSAIACGGRGIAFLAPSGVGKSTHTRLWLDSFPDVRVINGDKPIVRFDDGGRPVVYGTPWAGKERMQNNICSPLTDLCFIERAGQNSVSRIDLADAAVRIMGQVYIPGDPVAAEAAMAHADKLLYSCGLWIIRCNTDSDAAYTARRAILGDC